MANADLALPDYLSRIVNNGIQQNDVENAVPTALRESTLEKLILSTESDTDLVQDSYRLVMPDDPESKEYLDEIPGLAEEAIYLLEDVDKEEEELLNAALGKALLAVSGIERMLEDPSGAMPSGEGLGFDLSQIL